MGSASSGAGGSDEESKDDPDNQKSVHEGWESIREKKRGCTDCLCLLFLLLSWAATTVVGLIALGVIVDPRLPGGNPALLTHALDYNGRICGYGDGVTGKPFGYYLLDKTAICVSSCPTASNYTSFVCKDDYQAAASANAMVGFGLVLTRDCMYAVKTKPILNRCIPDVVAQAAATAAKSAAASKGADLSSAGAYPGSPGDANGASSGWFNTFLADVYSMRALIFSFGLGFSTVVAFGYTYFLRLPGLLFMLIWTLLLSILGCLVAGGLLLFFLAQGWKTDHVHTALDAQIAEYASFVIFGLSGLYLCLLLVIRSRIMLAIGVVKEAAKALATMPILILMPILQVIGMAIFLVPWIIYVLYLASSGSVVNMVGSYTRAGIVYNYNYRQFVYAENTKYAFLYMLFSWFWTSEFIIAIGQLTIALSVVSWYFTRPEHKWKIGSWTVLWAMGTVVLYHLGTAAFGSLVIAIVKTIQAVLAYLQKQAKRANNRVLQYLLCVLQCCMWCFEKFMKFLNKKAYIQTAIYGHSFCKAARCAFFLILRNILRVAAVTIVAEFVMLLGKLFVPCLTTLIFYVVLAYTPYGDEVTDVVSPSVFVFVMAYLVSAMFSEIFAMTIDTVLCCYIADEEMFPLEKRFADGGLKSALQRAAQKNANKKTAPEDKYAVSAVDDQAPASKEAFGGPSGESKKVTINAHTAYHHPEGDLLL